MNAQEAEEVRSLKGKVALIMGSTSSIGLRIAEALAARGAKIAINGRSEESAAKALEGLRGAGIEAIYVKGDSRKYEEIESAIRATSRDLGPIDILISSGGTPNKGVTLFSDYKPEELMKSIEDRLLPRIYPVHAVLPEMRKRNRGSIILLNTDAARHPTPGEALIGAAGAAVMLMTKTLAKEFSRWRIRVNCINLTLTSGTTRFEKHLTTPGQESAVFTKALSRFPFGAAPTADEVAHVAAFLASNESSQITGQTISVNGGLSFGGW